MRTRGHSCVHVRSAEEEILKNITAPDYLEIRDCGVKGRGVFTITSQPKGSYVCFYSGKRVRIEPQCDDDSYLFELKNGSRKIWIDATEEDGSYGRLLNDDHISPNLKAKVLTVGKEVYPAFFAQRDIGAGVELTYDYGGGSYWWRKSAHLKKKHATDLSDKTLENVSNEETGIMVASDSQDEELSDKTLENVSNEETGIMVASGSQDEELSDKTTENVSNEETGIMVASDSQDEELSDKTTENVSNEETGIMVASDSQDEELSDKTTENVSNEETGIMVASGSQDEELSDKTTENVSNEETGIMVASGSQDEELSDKTTENVSNEETGIMVASDSQDEELCDKTTENVSNEETGIMVISDSQDEELCDKTTENVSNEETWIMVVSDSQDEELCDKTTENVSNEETGIMVVSDSQDEELSDKTTENVSNEETGIMVASDSQDEELSDKTTENVSNEETGIMVASDSQDEELSDKTLENVCNEETGIMVASDSQDEELSDVNDEYPSPILSKRIPVSAVEIPGHMMTTLDVQCGNLEFGADSSPLSFGENETASNAYTSTASSSTSTINNRANAQVGQVPLSKTNESEIPSSIMAAASLGMTGLDKNSPRGSNLYQESPYTTPTKQEPTENTKSAHLKKKQATDLSDKTLENVSNEETGNMVASDSQDEELSDKTTGNVSNEETGIMVASDSQDEELSDKTTGNVSNEETGIMVASDSQDEELSDKTLENVSNEETGIMVASDSQDEELSDKTLENVSNEETGIMVASDSQDKDLSDKTLENVSNEETGIMVASDSQDEDLSDKTTENVSNEETGIMVVSDSQDKELSDKTTENVCNEETGIMLVSDSQDEELSDVHDEYPALILSKRVINEKGHITRALKVVSEEADSTSELEFVHETADATGELEAVVTENSVQRSSKNANGNHKLDKVQACYYCKKEVLKIGRHLLNTHKTETAVQKITALKEMKNANYLKELDKIKCLGNFNHNVEVLAKGHSNIIVAKRPSKVRPPKDFVPCPHCFGFYVQEELWRHVQKCPFACEEIETQAQNRHRLTILASSRVLLEGAVLEQAGVSGKYVHIKKTVLAHARTDSVYLTVVADDLILSFGCVLLKKLGPGRGRDITQRMRQLSRLLIMLNTRQVDGTLSLNDYVTAAHFDDVVKATEELCGLYISKEGRRIFDKPSLALRLGHLLHKICDVKLGMAIRKTDDIAKQESEDFRALHKAEWTDSISSNALNSLKRRKDHEVCLLPLTEDLVMVRKYIMEEISSLVPFVMTDHKYTSWRKLSQLIMTRLILFNKRRGGEVSRLLLKTYTERPNWKLSANSEVVASLKPLEKELLQRMDLLQIPGKRDRKVPLLVTEDTKRGMEVLVSMRGQCGIPEENPYFFASKTKTGYLESWQSMSTVVNKTDVKNPQLITSTRLRKYNATVCQLVDLGPQEMEWLANHMGHSLNIHRNFYRLHDSIIEMAKVSRLLMAVDNGQVADFHGKSLDDISVNELTVKQVEKKLEEDEENSDEVSLDNALAHVEESNKDATMHEPEELPEVQQQKQSNKNAAMHEPDELPEVQQGKQRFRARKRRVIESSSDEEIDSKTAKERAKSLDDEKSISYSRLKRIHNGGPKSHTGVEDSSCSEDETACKRLRTASANHHTTAHVKWTAEEVAVLKQQFGHIMRKNSYPSGIEINALIRNGSIQKGRTVMQIKSKLQHLMKRQ